ncbi:hypothetical protein C8R46DRAFT_392072 [Mycena filopes]|nr:hypothetical protein C8R46DRAFT_392072 [Mycena filopes]
MTTAASSPLCGRLPSEILLEIFKRHLEATDSGHPYLSSSLALRPLLRVSSRWRAIVLSSPYLWRYFDVDDEAVIGRISLQLQSSAQGTLSISLRILDTRVFLLFLDASTRWEEANLMLGTARLGLLFRSAYAFRSLCFALGTALRFS